MVVTATELKANLGRYLSVAQQEDVLISKNGRTVAKLCNPYAERGAAMRSLFGILPADVTVESARSARARDKWQLS
jgi:prevent-host-death family protein